MSVSASGPMRPCDHATMRRCLHGIRLAPLICHQNRTPDATSWLAANKPDCSSHSCFVPPLLVVPFHCCSGRTVSPVSLVHPLALITPLRVSPRFAFHPSPLQAWSALSHGGPSLKPAAFPEHRYRRSCNLSVTNGPGAPREGCRAAGPLSLRVRDKYHGTTQRRVLNEPLSSGRHQGFLFTCIPLQR